MSKSARQIPPVLELFRIGPGVYSLRLTDPKDNYIAVKLAELIPDLGSLQVITPTDMKVFRFDGENNIPQKTNGKLNNPDVNLNNTPGEEIEDSMDEVDRLAAMDAHTDAPPAEKRGRGRPKKSAAERQDTCQRCRGLGKVQQLMDGGTSTEAACPVCQGEGTITRFGVAR